MDSVFKLDRGPFKTGFGFDHAFEPAWPSPDPPDWETGPDANDTRRNTERAFVTSQAAAGQRDRNALTNLVFFRRHPELRGRKLRFDEHDLVAEWKAILRDIVSPAMQSPAAPSTATPPGTPALPGTTFYLPINLTKEGKAVTFPARTGIYLPSAFTPAAGVEVLLYLHGMTRDYPGPGALINAYWDGKRFEFFALREEVEASGRNLVFVAPSLGDNPNITSSLAEPGGFDAYLKRVISGLNERLAQDHKRGIGDVRRIVLAAHSAGGNPMLKIALGKDQYTARIAECWCFDGMYGSVAAAWAAWAKAHPQASLHVYYGPARGQTSPSPRDNAEKIACLGKTNVCVQPSRAKPAKGVDAHFWVPKVHLPERLRNSPCPAGDACPPKRKPGRSEMEHEGAYETCAYR